MDATPVDPVRAEPARAASAPTADGSADRRRAAMDDARYGEAVVREELGAEFIEEIVLDGREEVR